MSALTRRHAREARDRQHGDADDGALQARLAQPVRAGRAAAQSRRRTDGGRGVHAALHSGARGPEPADRVPRSLASATPGHRGMPAGRGARHRQPQERARRVGRVDPRRAPDEARRRRRRHRRRVSRLARDRAAGDSRVPSSARRADESHRPPGARPQRADRLRRRAGVSRRRRRRRCRRRRHPSGASRRRACRRGRRDDGVRGLRHRGSDEGTLDRRAVSGDGRADDASTSPRGGSPAAVDGRSCA